MDQIVSMVIIIAVMLSAIVAFVMWTTSVSEKYVHESHLFMRVDKVERGPGGWNVTVYVENPSGYPAEIVEVRVNKHILSEYNVTFYNWSELPLYLKPGQSATLVFFFPDTVFSPGGLVEMDFHCYSGTTYVEVARFTLR